MSEILDVVHQHQINKLTIHHDKTFGVCGLCIICNKMFKIIHQGEDDEILILIESCAICGIAKKLPHVAYSESTNFKVPEKVCSNCWKNEVEKP